jgi:fibro-slime domain-containing protein
MMSFEYVFLKTYDVFRSLSLLRTQRQTEYSNSLDLVVHQDLRPPTAATPARAGCAQARAPKLRGSWRQNEINGGRIGGGYHRCSARSGAGCAQARAPKLRGSWRQNEIKGGRIGGGYHRGSARSGSPRSGSPRSGSARSGSPRGSLTAMGASSRVWLVAGLALSALWVVLAQERLVYRLTMRDMLPAVCMENSAYMKAWGDLGTPPATLSAADYASDSLSGNLTISPGSLNPESVTKAQLCPYFNSMRAGLISGHPDFEASVNQFANGIANDFSVTPCSDEVKCWKYNIQPIVDVGGLVTDGAGLRKLQSCATPDARGRCGAQLVPNPTKYGAAKTEFFSSWYSDSAKYSKRIGTTLELTRDAQGLYVFDSGSAEGVKNPAWNPLGGFVSSATEQLYPNFEDAPAWPVAPLSSSTGKYWYTTELHTFFQYNGGEKFSFSGDDDVWVWINGKLAIDMGGLHAAYRQSINLDALQGSHGLAKGGIYSLDMFHAERHTFGSNFKITTTLTSNCNVLRSGSTVVDSGSPGASAESWLALGAAQVSGANQLRLVPPGSVAGDASAVYLRSKFNAGAGFVVQFSFSVSRLSARRLPQGFALLLHNRDEGLVNLPVTTGDNLNYRNIPNSTAVVFELCQDPDAGCKQQEVSLQRAARPGDVISPGASPRKTRRAPVLRTLSFPQEVHNVSVEYLETPDWLEVYIDNSLYLREEGFSVRSALLGRDAFLGFTSSVAQANAATITISNVKVSSVSISPANTTVEPAAVPADAPANGRAAAKVSFRTRDLCGNPVDNGGFASQAAALFVEELAAERQRRRRRRRQRNEWWGRAAARRHQRERGLRQQRERAGHRVRRRDGPRHGHLHGRPDDAHAGLVLGPHLLWRRRGLQLHDAARAGRGQRGAAHGHRDARRRAVPPARAGCRAHDAAHADADAGAHRGLRRAARRRRQDGARGRHRGRARGGRAGGGAARLVPAPQNVAKGKGLHRRRQGVPRRPVHRHVQQVGPVHYVGQDAFLHARRRAQGARGGSQGEPQRRHRRAVRQPRGTGRARATRKDPKADERAQRVIGEPRRALRGAQGVCRQSEQPVSRREQAAGGSARRPRRGRARQHFV